MAIFAREVMFSPIFCLVFVRFKANFLCFLCPEKWTLKLPVFPVLWQPYSMYIWFGSCRKYERMNCHAYSNAPKVKLLQFYMKFGVISVQSYICKYEGSCNRRMYLVPCSDATERKSLNFYGLWKLICQFHKGISIILHFLFDICSTRCLS